MGIFGFIKNGVKTLGHVVGNVAKKIGHTVAPVVHSVASAIHNYAPIAGNVVGALTGQPEIALAGRALGKIAGKVSDVSDTVGKVARGIGGNK